ncbi:TPA: DNA repair protein RadA [bacterium]|nr:DNA repair protein RadA [bacterium]
MAKFYCQECGYESLKWFGRCPGCGQWNTFVEEPSPPPSKYPTFRMTHQLPQPLSEVQISESPRSKTGIEEFDRVLGGGVVPGSLILIGGDPGIGKSTLLLTAADRLSKALGVVLYLSGEESNEQTKLRAERIGISSKELYILNETNLDYVNSQVESLRPRALVIDSIQTIYAPQISSSPGSVGQVRECTAQLLYLAKQESLPIFIIGHVTKEGAIAGPRTLEHIVDTVLYFEGEGHHPYRILRAVKNRFGPTNEIGVFAMHDEGLVEVANPSSCFLQERPEEAPGSVVIPSIEGTRPILVELQSLVTPTSFGIARREALGVDYNRVVLLLAVLEKRVGLHLGSQDVFVNVVGGVKLFEPALDLGIILSVVSSFRDKPIDPGLVCFGEVGLTGEIRGVLYTQERLREAAKLGFKKCLMPKHNAGKGKIDSLQIVTTGSIKEALEEVGLI